MKIWDNGVIRDMTPEEVADWESQKEEIPEIQPTLERRVEDLEALNNALLGIDT